VADVEVLDAGGPPVSPARRRGRPRRRWRGSGVLAGIAGLLAFGLIAGTAVGGWLVQRPFPQTEGRLQVDGLTAPVQVLRDARGVPTIVAETADDLFFAQGYVHAQDRFWEMDVRRHITAGRLSEMFGAGQVETDAFVRTLGWRRIAEEEVEQLSPETTAALAAYASGVNAYLDSHDDSEISLEYAVLGLTARGYSIEPWTPADSVSWLKAMAWDLRGNLEEETDRTLLVPTVRSSVEDLYPPYPYARHDVIVSDGSVTVGRWRPGPSTPQRLVPLAASPGVVDAVAAARSGAERLDGWLGAYGPGVGSNSFAVTGDRTASGGALLANDPHLAPSLPGIWYQANLQCAVVDAACPYRVGGFTFSGVPGVIIGHNDRIAWGFTNNGSDVTDLAYEALNGDRYVRDGRLQPLDVSTETIVVAGGDPVEVRVRTSEWGPLISDASDEHQRAIEGAFSPADLPGNADEVAIALKWTALEPGRTADAILALNAARDFADFRTAAVSFQVPSQNMLYADVDGHIGYQMPGRIPVRENGDGTTPVPGWNTAYGWSRYIPFGQLPWTLDPPEQYIVAANQAVVGSDYPYLLTRDWSYGYRSQRLIELIEQADPLTPASAAALMTDTVNGFAPTLVPRLLEVDLQGFAAEAQQLLDGWRYDQPVDSAPAAYYNAVWRHLLARVFHDELTDDVRPDGGDRWFEVMRDLLADPWSRWWDDTRTEDIEFADEVIAGAMQDAADELVERLGDDPAAWRWGELHQLELTHQTFGASGIGPLEALFNRGPFGTAGGDGIVNATGWNAAEGYEVNWVPSMRMVVDLTDLDASRWVHLTGQSGHVFDPHYADQTDAWLTGRTYPWPFTVQAASASSTQQLVLEP
jgi:penicillin amidase